MKINSTKNRKVQSVTTTNAFAQAMQIQSNYGLTENAALTNKSTLNYVLDWFGAGGALRQRDQASIISLFSKAYAHDKILAMKILFYFRDVREGQGERNTFRILINWLALHHTESVRKNLENISYFGRFDDLYALVGTPLESDIYAIFGKQLKEDLKNMKKDESVSLLAKWLKSMNTSSAESCRLGKKTCEALELSPKRYRKILSALRKYIDVLEVKMCGQNWSDINFERVPSRASLNYRKAFGRHDQTRYAAYLESVKKGEKKMNAGAIFPYEIFKSLIPNIYSTPSPQDILQADLQWKSMPNWMGDKGHLGLVIADVSGSMMSGIPNIWVAVSLALYFAERNTGPFKDLWMNFSSSPSFQRFIGSNIWEKFSNMDKQNWSGSTNLQAAFDLILSTSLQNKVLPKDMPTVLYIVSDLEFNSASENSITNYDVIKQKYQAAGYKIPNIVWWNVASRNDNFPIKVTDTGTMLVSGCSPSILKSILSVKAFDPMSVVYETVNRERYDRVTA